ncbi:NAD(P)H-dependent oxidoreductase [Amycolatopsis sp. SID8362]|uniref:NADPH-dependent FMN reductase n=1 Tax=Amycolatopsis sp. SID8362 TaxID=2690346 RepID=UPI0013704E93|nr:NAD(P)H-dependent oxidoreductase [Amycolatopsis sp. SID8362]NBH04078.1 NADPH-dependent FMN reductase [Amycolatopsis sp. SID8362]NED40778.1 NAD(P)H-dependent oxidoreductase [Amycolatopsis sp. SID8362]
MSEAPVRVAVIVGSVREGRFGPVVAAWLAGVAGESGGFEVDVVDLAEPDLPLAMPAFGSAPAPSVVAEIGKVTPRLAAADAFVVVTPEYNHSYPASLKNAIDWHRDEWRAKPVAFVSYGGISGGLRAVEHLRAVFAELHAVTIRETVSFHGAHTRFGPDGTPTDEAAGVAAKAMLDQLGWWARSLTQARAARPYPG